MRHPPASPSADRAPARGSGSATCVSSLTSFMGGVSVVQRSVGEGAALGEDAADLDLARTGKKTGDGVEAPVVLALAAAGHTAQQPDGVGVSGVVEDLARRGPARRALRRT